ncbi:MAG: hypothetical protein EXQ96_07715 [Alphaproteobacteria bacterium]|nr:hypothetical protein [Alphaproteobacteria bacterium]
MVLKIWARLIDWVFGPAPARDLPDRLRSAIRDQEDAAEILIGWVQMSGIVTFAVLYSLSPKTFPMDAMFAPVPWALSAYAVFTAVRLVLAYRRRLPTWVIGLSVLVDMAVLMVTIWSFHLQYQQPAAFYLKAPTLLYVFILIALRSLRFDPHFVVMAGIAAALGWLVLVAYAVFEGGGMQALITRDFTVYMTSARILLGAEFDKVISIGMVTALLEHFPD